MPGFLASGVLASVLGLFTMVWSALYVHRPYGGAVLIGLSLALLLVGGGISPPLTGIIAGVVATRIRSPLRRRAGGALRFLAALWPWPLAVFFTWVFGQLLVGAYFNTLVQELGLLSPLLIVGLLTLSVVSGCAHDVRRSGGDLITSGGRR